MKNRKYVFVIGGVMSGVGKGIATASIGAILDARGCNVNLVKVDPYLNVDAGTMNPTEHGEVFVLDSGLETDQDLGNYERFLDRDLTSDDYMTSGMVYKTVIDRERSLGYDGRCIEAIPTIRDEIEERYKRAAEAHDADITIIEIGGTIGDYQNIMFMEAARVMKVKYPEDVAFIMVSYLPIPGNLGEMKTRPTQNAVRQLNSYGIQPDLILARSRRDLDDKRKEKIAISCNVKKKNVISAPDVSNIYKIPENFERDNLGSLVLEALYLEPKQKHADLSRWNKFVAQMRDAKEELPIAIVGKYFDTGEFTLSDSYLSVIEAIKFSAAELGVKPNIHWLNSKDFENGKHDVSELSKYAGIIVPGGFGETGIEGKLAVIKYARENKIPYFGLCYGLQLLTVEYMRNVVGEKEANTHEIDPHAAMLVVDILPEQRQLLKDGNYGGTMRLGTYPAKLKEGTIAHDAYVSAGALTKEIGGEEIHERHRHRYEINPDYVGQLKKAGLVFSGMSPDGVLTEIAELPKDQHPFMLGTQFHPELKARPFAPHPLFTAFIQAAVHAKT